MWLAAWFVVQMAGGGMVQDEGSVGGVAYPYVATPMRSKQIKDGLHRIRTGATMADVKAILGSPDETTALYRSVKGKSKVVGTHLWYLVEKRVKGDNVNAKLVRVSIDLDGKVMRVSHWGFSKKDDRQEP